MRALYDIFAQGLPFYWSLQAALFPDHVRNRPGAVASLLLLIGLGEGFRAPGQRRGLSELGTDFIMMFGGTSPALPSQRHWYAALQR